MRVQDAETGEWLVIPDTEDVASTAPQSPGRYAAAGMFSPHSLRDSIAPIHAETQSTRMLGDHVGWQSKMDALREEYARAARESLRGLFAELENPHLTQLQRQELQVKILEKMKHRLKTQLEGLVAEELAREEDRQAKLHAEVSSVARNRLAAKHATERSYYASLITHMREEGNLLLTATMEQFNMLR
ncbi:hypothetical protein ACHHYP_00615 [Achlya hypogyna]|uniref:Uncharacterized protein n=1 Tax=Achlya hypogyna TaxID=1202772 RepID=A0A1V9ZUE3_ACHHY|nr:hypothetical protein ACHHYP_00615 [Achlya hypogyna]